MKLSRSELYKHVARSCSCKLGIDIPVSISLGTLLMYCGLCYM